MSGAEHPAPDGGGHRLGLREGSAPSPVVPAAVSTRLLVACLACAALFVVLAAAVAANASWLTGFDSRLSQQCFAFTVDHTGIQPLVRWATQLGDGRTVTVVTTAAVIWCAVQRRWALVGWLVVVVAGSALLSTLVKHAVQRTRPPSEGVLTVAHGFSFPSGHTQAATVTYTAVVLVAGWALARPGPRARWASVAIVVVLVGAVGLSRVFLGVHWPTDVIGGWLLGSAWVAAATYVLLRLTRSQCVRSALPDPSGDAGGDIAD